MWQKENLLWDVQNAETKIVRLQPRSHPLEKIFQQVKDVVVFCYSAQSVYFVGPVVKEKPFNPQTIGFALTAAGNLKHE